MSGGEIIQEERPDWIPTKEELRRDKALDYATRIQNFESTTEAILKRAEEFLNFLRPESGGNGSSSLYSGVEINQDDLDTD